MVLKILPFGILFFSFVPLIAMEQDSNSQKRKLEEIAEIIQKKQKIDENVRFNCKDGKNITIPSYLINVSPTLVNLTHEAIEKNQNIDQDGINLPEIERRKDLAVIMTALNSISKKFQHNHNETVKCIQDISKEKDHPDIYSLKILQGLSWIKSFLNNDYHALRHTAQHLALPLLSEILEMKEDEIKNQRPFLLTSLSHLPPGQKINEYLLKSIEGIKTYLEIPPAIHKISEGKIRCVSSDGHYIAVEKDQHIHIMTNTQNIIQRFPYNKKIRTIFFSHDNQSIVVSDDMSIKLWDITTGICTKHINTCKDMIILSPNSRSIITKLLGRILISWDISIQKQLFDNNDGKVINEQGFDLQSRGLEIKLLAPSPDNKHIAIACSDETIEIWNMITGEKTAILGQQIHPITFLIWSHENRLISTDQNSIKIWDTKTHQKIRELYYPVDLISVDPMNNSCVVYSKKSQDIRIFDLNEENNYLILKTITYYHPLSLRSLKWNNNILLGITDDTIFTWNFNEISDFLNNLSVFEIALLYTLHKARENHSQYQCNIFEQYLFDHLGEKSSPIADAFRRTFSPYIYKKI